MKTSAIFPSIFRLLLIAAIGTGLGLSLWQLIGFNRPNKVAAWLGSLMSSALPILLPASMLAWVCSVIVYLALLRSHSTRVLGVKGLITMLTLWLVVTLIVIGGLYAGGTAYPYGTTVPTLMDIIILVVAAAYLAAYLIGFIIAPLLVIQIFPFLRTKLFEPKPNEKA